NEGGGFLTSFFPNSRSQAVGALLGGLGAGQHTPQIGGIRALDQARRAVAGLHFGAQGHRDGGGRGVFGGADHFDANAGGTRTDHVDSARGSMGEIDDAALDKGAAVGDANFHSLGIVEVDDPEPGVEGESAVGGGQLLHVVDLAIGGAPAVVGGAVP